MCRVQRIFPNNAVEFFVSYYDYYQPEAYIPGADIFIEKDSAINDEIDKLRHSATLSLFDRKDVIVVASVSCIYGLGDPIDYKNMVISLRPGMEKSREELIEKLVELQYNRNDISLFAEKTILVIPPRLPISEWLIICNWCKRFCKVPAEFLGVEKLYCSDAKCIDYRSKKKLG